MNPWGLTPRQAQAFHVFVASGSNKQVARELDIAVETAEAHLRDAVRRMGAPNRVVAAIAWDRWAREQSQVVTRIAATPFTGLGAR